ncbi:MAG: ClpXP protease specificity-enhancing factor [Beggiatoa sp. IS2]|nr:MAG: ClpXP protease specificity-enhancing factor [Beggiatoa sp. IS2]
MTPKRPYLLRAMYAWITDNGLTPYLLVNAEAEGVAVPRQYVSDGKIVLNVSLSAVQNLFLDDNDWVSFSARFSGHSFSVTVPMQAVLAIYAQENGKGMSFQPEETDTTPPPAPHPPPRAKPVLKRVK